MSDDRARRINDLHHALGILIGIVFTVIAQEIGISAYVLMGAALVVVTRHYLILRKPGAPHE